MNTQLIQQAVELLIQALNETGTPTPIPDNKEYHDYGVNSYTDSLDPRGPHAKSHVDNESIHLTVHQGNNKYKVQYVDSIWDKHGNGGKHIARVNVPQGFNGQIVLATGYQGGTSKFDSEILHSPGQEVVIDGKFTPPALGPLAIYLKENGVRVSDIVGNIGLPKGNHVSYVINFT